MCWRGPQLSPCIPAFSRGLSVQYQILISNVFSVDALHTLNVLLCINTTFSRLGSLVSNTTDFGMEDCEHVEVVVGRTHRGWDQGRVIGGGNTHVF